MIKRTLQLPLLFCGLCIMVFSGYQCNSIIDATTYSSQYVPNTLEETFYRKDTLFLFRPLEGSLLDFYGTRACTTTTKESENATPITTATEDSIFIRFTTGRDTFLLTSDSLEGEARFQPNDVPTLVHWDNILTKFPPDSLEHPMALILVDFLSPIQVDSFMLLDSAYKLTKSNKTAFITALNAAVNADTLLSHYHRELHETFASDTNFAADVKRLLKENIFTDTNGTLSSALSFVQKETLKRFNFRIFAKYFDSNMDYPMFSKHPVNGRVFIETIEKGHSPFFIEEKVTRFFKVTDKTMFQLSFLDQNVMVKPKNTVIGPYFLVTDVVWNISPLVSCSDIPPSLIPMSQSSGLMQSGKAIVRFDSLVSMGVNRKHYTLTMLYPILGSSVFPDGKPYTVSGMITVTARIYNNSSIDITLVEPDHDVCYYTDMIFVIDLHAKNATGKQINYREKRVLKNIAAYNRGNGI